MISLRSFGSVLCSLTVLAFAPRGVAAAEGDAAWESLFDGRSLAGWKAAEHPESITVEAGTIRCLGPRAHLFYLGKDGKAEFENFELELEVKTEPGANSGVYFHVRWEPEGWPRQAGIEVQVNNHQPAFEKNYVENKKTGSLYGVRNLYKPMAVDGEWFTLRVIVQRPRVEVRLNGRTVVSYVEPINPPVLEAGTTRDHLGKGTFALQCHDEKSEVRYRNIRVRRLSDGEDASVVKPEYTATDAAWAGLARENFPLVDLHTHLSEVLPLREVLAVGDRTGIRAGIATPGGEGRQVHDDTTAAALVAAMKDEAVFLGLEVESPTWLTHFTPETRATFDYITADAAVWAATVPLTDNTDAYVEALVSQAERALAEGPIDVWFDPTYLPPALESLAAELWTNERLSRLLAAAVKHGVAFGINTNARRPSAEFVRAAKGAGVRLTFGSANRGKDDYGQWNYLLEVQPAAKLGWRDLWVPGHAPTRAQKAAKKN